MPEALVIVVAVVVTASLAAAGPALLRWLPEPEPKVDSDSGGQSNPDVQVATAEASVKVPYAELAERPRLAIKLGVCGALVGLVLGWVLADERIVIAWVFLGGVGTVLGYIDAQTRLLPTRIIAPSYGVLVALILLTAALDGDAHDLIRAGYGWLAFGGFYFLMWFIYPSGLGYGDVRLAGLLGMALGYLGWGPVLVGMYAGFLLGGVGGGLLALVKVVDRRRYPFGPFMLVGSLVGLAWGASFADWYAGI